MPSFSEQSALPLGGLHIRWVIVPHGQALEAVLPDLTLDARPKTSPLSWGRPEHWVRIDGLTETVAHRLAKTHLALLPSLHVARRQQVSASSRADTHVLLCRGELPQLESWSAALLAEGEALGAALHAWLTPQTQPLADWSIREQIWSFPRSRPLVMGIVNVTPDSFSDGGLFYAREQACSHALAMVEAGADLVDVGGESTRPGAVPVSAEEEEARVVPVIEAIRAKSDVVISIDTWKSSVAEAALNAGADVINDISCLRFDIELAAVAATHDVPLILMHSRHRPADMQKKPHYDDLWGELLGELELGVQRAMAAGVAPSRIAIDPGIGFGKRFQDNYRILREMQVLRSMPFPILIGASRKSFLAKVLDDPAPRRLEGSLAAAAQASWAGADMLRVHDVAETVKLLRVLEEIQRGGMP